MCSIDNVSGTQNYARHAAEGGARAGCGRISIARIWRNCFAGRGPKAELPLALEIVYTFWLASTDQGRQIVV